MLGQFAAFTGLIFSSMIVRAAGQADLRLYRVLIVLEVIGWVAFFIQIPFTYVALRIDYEMRWYIVTDRSLRIREGVLTVKEKTMTFANIQNMTVRQGPVQRLLKIANLEVRTAGGGALRNKEKGQLRPRDDMHLGFFRGVDNAAEIRDLIRDRVREYRDSGLGDPDEPPASDEATTVARQLLAEVQALRVALTTAPR